MNNPVWTAEAGRRGYASATWKWLTPASMTAFAALFDPRNEPAGITPATARLPDAFVQAQLSALRDPAGKVSGWANVHYDLRSANTTNRYDVQIYR